MPARFATDLYKSDVGAALNDTDDQNLKNAWQMARTTIGNMGMKDIAAIQGRMSAASRGIGTSSGKSGFNWGGAFGSLAGSALGGAFGGFGGGNKLGGFDMKGSLYNYTPSGIDFSSGWR